MTARLLRRATLVPIAVAAMLAGLLATAGGSAYAATPSATWCEGGTVFRVPGGGIDTTPCVVWNAGVVWSEGRVISGVSGCQADVWLYQLSDGRSQHTGFVSCNAHIDTYPWTPRSGDTYQACVHVLLNGGEVGWRCTDYHTIVT